MGIRTTTWIADAGVELHRLQLIGWPSRPGGDEPLSLPGSPGILDVGAAYSRWWAQSAPTPEDSGLSRMAQ
jgi:hypothetical protein